MGKQNLGTALVTGASSGIGAVYARRLAQRGYNLVLVARDKARLSRLAAELSAETGVAIGLIAADLTNRADLLLVERRLRQDSTITLLINNAGMSIPGTLLEADLDRLEQMIQLNVMAATRLAIVAAQAFAARKTGAIINMASVLALAPELFHGGYSGAKAFILNLSQALQAELAPHGVRVQAVLPGATRTEIWQKSGKDVTAFPPDFVMEVDDMVDAALAGFDQGETVTIPSLPDMSDWDNYLTARQHLRPNLSRSHPAARYTVRLQ